jgi:probable rRNA maturation factor
MAARARLRVNLSAPDRAIPASRGLAAWLSRTAPASASGEVTVALVSDRRMRALNRMFRDKDHATDVLSFPVGSRETEVPRGGSGQVRRALETPSLGDIVIATGVAARQAKEHGHTVGTEFRVLALHGLLHLLGYDHEADAGRMARAEARLQKKGGLSTGLIARAAGSRGRSTPGSHERATPGRRSARR